jgi:hypothetical protein
LRTADTHDDARDTRPTTDSGPKKLTQRGIHDKC